MAIQPLLQESPDFSLVLGGPLYQLLRKGHLAGPTLELLRRRMLLAALVAWLPLAVLTVIEGHFTGANLMFLHDFQAHARFLIAVPVLIGAELIVHQRVRPMVRRFLERGFIKPEEMPKFLEAIEAATRLRNSSPLEVGLVIFVYTGGLWLWRNEVAMETATWYAVPAGAHIHLTLAGYWQLFVSLPIFQFILLRWYLRLFIWLRFLWAVSRLQLLPAHPDRAGLPFWAWEALRLHRFCLRRAWCSQDSSQTESSGRARIFFRSRPPLQASSPSSLGRFSLH